MGRYVITAALAALALAFVPASAGAAVKAGAAKVDASWHVGASAGQYASDGTFVSDHGIDPASHSTRRASSYGRQSQLSVRAIVVDGADGKKVAVLKNDLYLPGDLLHRRTAQLLEAGDSGVTRETLTMAVTHNHSSPYYSSPSAGVWTFQDVFDVRFFDYYARKQAEAVEKAAASMKPVRVGASVNQFDKTHRHSFGPATADDGTPAGYPQPDTDHDMVVVRFDDISEPGNPKPLANLVNFPLHPEFLDGNDLITADYLGPLERMADRETGAITILTQGSVGTAEPERSTYHSIHERLEFSHKEYGQAEYAARLMADSIVGAWKDIGRGDPQQSGDPARFVSFMTDFPVEMKDKWYPGPFSHPFPGVSNCRTDRTLDGDPQIPIVGLPDCASPFKNPLYTAPLNPLKGANPGLNTHAFERLGIPVPSNYSAPSYGALEEDLNIHLQAFRLGDILFTVCSCEQWKDQGANIKTRTDKIEGNQYNGYNWVDRCTRKNDGSYGDGPEGYGDGTWDCTTPDNGNARLASLPDENVQRMKAQVNNPANGWNNLENTASAESEPADVRQIKGNFTHDDDARSAELGYKLTVTIGMANDYNGYIASYREYQRGDHYRKALTAWGPHSADYMATRLVTLGRLLKAPAEPLPTDQQQESVEEPRIIADNVFNDARSEAFGTTGAGLIAAYEAKLPDDGGEARALEEPAEEVERFRAAFFTWNGGSNFTDNPDVRVQRRVDGEWRDYADSSGEVPITLQFPQGPDVPSYETGSFEWRWTAHFEPFVSRFDLGDRPLATPPGAYRFVVDGLRRDGRKAVPYTVTSREFRVAPWSGITVDDVREEPDGRVSFAIGPRTTVPVTGGGGPDMTDEIGPIDYPDSYDSPARFIDDARTFLRDPDARDNPDLLEWFCLHCSWRPWADEGDAETVELTVVGAGGSEKVAATRDGDRWVSARPLAEGESAYVARGCARDAHGNYNGAASAVVGGDPAPAPVAECAVDRGPVDDGGGDDGDAVGPGGGSGSGGAGGTGGTGSGGAGEGRGGSGNGHARPRCVRATGRLRGRRVGRAALGRTRVRNRRAFPSHARSRRTTDRFCFSDGRHLRIGYPSRALLRTLPARLRKRVRGRAIFVSTSSSRYSARGIRHGSTLASLARAGGMQRYRVGLNDWYVRRGRWATLLFKVRDGRVREVGLGDRRLTTGRKRTARFLGSFE